MRNNKHTRTIVRIFLCLTIMIFCACGRESSRADLIKRIADSLGAPPPLSAEEEHRRRRAYLDDMNFSTQADTQFVAFFEMDDKYHSDTLTALHLDKWTRERIEDLFTKPIENFRNIFIENGGGPAGSQWNSDADLFCVLFTRFRLNDSLVLRTSDTLNKISVYLNGKKYKTVVSERRRSDSYELVRIYSFSIPQKDWSKALKNVRKTDLHFLFDSSVFARDPEAALANSFVKIEVRVESKSKRKSLHGYFRIAYGE